MLRAALALVLVAFAVEACADQARVLLPRALAGLLEPGMRSGLVIGVEARADGALVSIDQSLRPHDAAPASLDPAACPDPSALEVPRGFRVPAALSDRLGGAGDPLETVLAVVLYVGRELRLDENDIGQQDAVSVLARGRGRCSGRANAAVGLLRAVGVPARVVHGIMLGERGGRWHRWGEAWLGALGWVPFDPGVAVGAVSVRYLPLDRGPETGGLENVRVLEVSETGFAALPRREGLRMVPVGGARLVCRAPAESPLTASLRAPDGTRWTRRGDGVVSFERLMPGRYRLEWELGPGRGVSDLDIVDDREVRLDAATARGEEGR